MNYYCIAALVLIAAFGSWTSRINQFFFFGRTVSDEFRQSDAARLLVRRYLLSIWLSVLPALALFLALRSRKPLFAAFLAILASGIFNNLIFAWTHAQVGPASREFPIAGDGSQAREVELLSPSSVPSLAAILAPVVCGLLVYAGALLLAGSASLAAAPSLLAEKVSAHGGDGLFGFAAGILGSSGILLVLMRTSTRIRTRMASHTLRSSLAVAWVGVVVLAGVFWFALFGTTIPRFLVKSTMGAVWVAAVVLIVWRMLKNKRFVPHAFEMQGDEHWRWGLYYHNSADPALFVQSRHCTGYTLNFARLLAWPLMLFLLSPVAIMLILSARR